MGVYKNGRNSEVAAQRREMVAKFWAKVPPKYQGSLVSLFIFLLVAWSVYW